MTTRSLRGRKYNRSRRDKPRSYPTFSTWPRGSYVVGESFHFDAIRWIIAQQREAPTGEVCVQAQVVPEPDNPADPNAMLVMVGGLKVGYWLPRPRGF